MLSATSFPPGQGRRPLVTRAVVVVLCSATLLVASSPKGSAAARAPASAPRGAPLLAYYYIWYWRQSWTHAKTDYPLIGRYTSDDPTVMRRQILWAKQIGISGFLVSWKRTPTLNRRLAMLARIAGELRFKLALVYESLNEIDFPAPPATVRRDLAYFARRYAHAAAFSIPTLSAKPVVVWFGTGHYSTRVVASTRQYLGGAITLLAAAPSALRYRPLASAVDGDAAYLAAVDPHNPRYARTLKRLSTAVHAHHGVWIAPAAPGYDANAIGPTRSTVARHHGSTLRLSLATAQRSRPDAIGLVSWNQYGNNTEIEPSLRYHDQSLHALAATLHTTPPPASAYAIPSPPAPSKRHTIAFALTAVVFALLLTALAIRRRRTQHPTT